ncbi:MAG: DUF5808 domain-containing protein [Streptosporangiaceae bacterium]
MKGKLDRVALLTVGGLVGAAIARELATPASERTWHGSVAGVPYDFRPPTVDKVRTTLWAPEDPRVVKPHAFGLGWSVNVGRLVRLAREAAATS